jgi:hypothetical protein
MEVGRFSAVRRHIHCVHSLTCHGCFAKTWSPCPRLNGSDSASCPKFHLQGLPPSLRRDRLSTAFRIFLASVQVDLSSVRLTIRCRMFASILLRPASRSPGLLDIGPQVPREMVVKVRPGCWSHSTGTIGNKSCVQIQPHIVLPRNYS